MAGKTLPGGVLHFATYAPYTASVLHAAGTGAAVVVVAAGLVVVAPGRVVVVVVVVDGVGPGHEVLSMVPSVRIVRQRIAPRRLAAAKVAPRKSASVKLAPVRLVFFIFAPLNETPRASAFTITAPTKVASVKLARDMSAPERSAPVRSAPTRFAFSRSENRRSAPGQEVPGLITQSPIVRILALPESLDLFDESLPPPQAASTKARATPRATKRRLLILAT